MILKTSDLAIKRPDELEPDENRSLTNVLHLINGEHFAGAERVQDLLAIALPAFGYQADFACLKSGKFADIRKSRTKTHELRMRNSFDFFAANQVTRVIRASNYSLLHAHTPRTLLIGSIAAKRTGLPLIYHVHSPVGRDSTRKWRNRINTWVETRCLKAVDAMICVSGSLRNYMQEIGHDPSKLHVVRNGVPACFDFPHQNTPKRKWTLGTMALFRPRKGIETLLEALATLKQQHADIHLRAVGSFETPEYEIAVKQLVDKLGISESITWTGFQSDINAQFQQMDVFVLPSLFGEGLPMVVLEAMAQGIPVIASNVEGIPEAIRDDVDGLIFEPGSAGDLAAKIRYLHEEPNRWQQFSQNAIQRQRSELSDNSMAAGIAAVYDKLRRLV